MVGERLPRKTRAGERAPIPPRETTIGGMTFYIGIA
jgi:hypothetical protein